MVLPRYVQSCMDALENQGFSCYAVGGCVRDALLGLTPHDYDLCTNARPEHIRSVFSDHGLVLAGEKHGTVGVITEQGVVEITTYRTEGDYTDSRHPGWVAFVDDITGDLARRDFTVNAMAWSPTRGLADPFGGQQDLENKVLRAVGDAPARFQEDALRILRGVRFGVRFSLTPEENTLQAMFAHAGLLDNIARERVFDELCKLLPLVDAQDIQRYQPIFTQVIPELASAVGFEQHSPHHAYDVYTHTAHVVAQVPKDLTLRLAALLHDTGKVPTFTLDETGRGHFLGHAQVSARLADEILRRLKAPTQLREDVVFLIDHHMLVPTAERRLLRRYLSRYGAQRLTWLITLMKADCRSKGTVCDMSVFDEMQASLSAILAENACLTIKDLALNGHDLMALGYAGPAIGNILNALLQLVVDEEIPNTRNALLAAIPHLKEKP